MTSFLNPKSPEIRHFFRVIFVLHLTRVGFCVRYEQFSFFPSEYQLWGEVLSFPDWGTSENSGAPLS